MAYELTDTEQALTLEQKREHLDRAKQALAELPDRIAAFEAAIEADESEPEPT